MRVTREEDNNFTLLRLLLALMVVLGHFKLLWGIKEPPFPFNFADAAVDCFFVVSGFLIAGAYERSRGLWAFYVRRVFRLYPMYACVVLLQAAIMLALLPNGPLSEVPSTLRYLVANLALANFLQTDIGGLFAHADIPAINPSLWTLKIEIAFYLIVPLIFVGIRRWGWWTLVAIFVLSALYNGLLPDRFAKQLPGQLQFFAVGMALCLYGERLKLTPLVSLMITIGFLEAWSLGPIPTGIRPLVVGAFVFSFALGLRAVPMQFDMSYSVYLVHGPLIQTMILVGAFHDNLPYLAGVTGVVLGIAYLGERLVERPGNAMGYRLARMAAHWQPFPTLGRSP